METLPPLNALRVFEAVARLGGVRLAASELCVTPPAVSHHISKLEDHLGTALFIRRGRTLILTEAARNYLLEVGPSLEAIGRATAGVSERKSRETVTLAAPPTLISTWLMPRILDFMSRYSQLDVRVIDRMIFDPEEQGIDLALEYRFEPDPDLISKPILDDEIVVLASPEFATVNKISDLESTRGLTMIETERRLTSWRPILSSFAWGANQRFLFVSYSAHAFTAASRGVGIALGNRTNAQEIIDQGHLCIPFDLPEALIPPVPRYFLTTVSHKRRLKRVQLLWDWLEAEAAGAFRAK